jgi:hypothetical protein
MCVIIIDVQHPLSSGHVHVSIIGLQQPESQEVCCETYTWLFFVLDFVHHLFL